MSTRASAPRCASCAMPLAPDAEACAVCGARVPLIARSAPEGESEEDRPATSGPGTGAFGPVAAADEGARGFAPQGYAVTSAPLPGTEAVTRAPAGEAPRFDAAAAARDVRAAALPPAPGAPSGRRTSAVHDETLDGRVAARAGNTTVRGGRGVAPVAPAAVAPVGRRVAAYAVDLAVGAVAVLVGLAVGGAIGGRGVVVGAVLGLVVAVAQLLAEGLAGATLGSRLLGLRTVDARTASSPGVGRALVRQVVVALGLPVAGVGNWVVAASGGWDAGPLRRGWHDRASGTAVVLAAGDVPSPGRGARAGSGGAAGRPWTPAQLSTDASPVTDEPRGAAGDDTGHAVTFGPPRPGTWAVGTVPAPVPAPDVTAPDPVTEPVMTVPAPLSEPVGMVPAPVPAPVPVPDLLLDAPGALAAPGTAAPEPDLLPGPPEPDLLPAPPEPGRRDRGARLPAGPAEALPSDDVDLGDLEHTRVQDPGSLRRRTGTLALLFDTGERVRVVGRGLVGRGPRAEDGQDILHVVVLSDAARSLSRVHAEFGPEPADEGGAAVWVTDRGSTNGTVVVDPDGVARVLPAGTRAVVGAGWTVLLGDREVRVEDD